MAVRSLIQLLKILVCALSGRSLRRHVLDLRLAGVGAWVDVLVFFPGLPLVACVGRGRLLLQIGAPFINGLALDFLLLLLLFILAV